jgi:hypothetical protein
VPAMIHNSTDPAHAKHVDTHSDGRGRRPA